MSKDVPNGGANGATKQRLKDLRVVVTRDSSKPGALTEKLELHGAKVTEIPAIRIAPPRTWEPVDAALQKVSEFDWIVFASASAVDALFDRATELGVDVSTLKNVPQIAAIGTSTAKRVESKGLRVSFVPKSFIAESFVEQFPNYPNLKDQKILWPRTNIGRLLLADKLKDAGAIVDTIEVYRTTLPEFPEQHGESLVRLIQGNDLDIITVASAQTAKNLSLLLRIGMAEGAEREKLVNAIHDAENMEDLYVEKSTEVLWLLSTTIIAAIGPVTAEAARTYLGRCDLQAHEFSVDGLVETIALFIAELEQFE